VITAGGWRGSPVDVEQFGELALSGAHIGQEPLGSGAAFAAVVVEQDGLADAGQLAEQFADGHVQTGLFGFASHEMRDGQREDGVEHVDTDLLVGPVVHRAKRHHSRGGKLTTPFRCASASRFPANLARNTTPSISPSRRAYPRWSSPMRPVTDSSTAFDTLTTTCCTPSATWCRISR
jgi:hypothetical protein